MIKRKKRYHFCKKILGDLPKTSNSQEQMKLQLFDRGSSLQFAEGTIEMSSRAFIQRRFIFSNRYGNDKANFYRMQFNLLCRTQLDCLFVENINESKISFTR